MATLNTTIILRNDSTTNWLANSSVVLSRGEVGIEFLANGKVKMKIGDGEKTWEQLSYFGGDAAKYFEVIPEVAEDGSVEIHLEAINRVVNGAELAGGDIAIVKETFATGRTQHTAYVYDEATSAWKAMDGNYSADNVYVAEDLTLAGNFTSVGNYEKGDTIAAGTSLQDVLSSMLQQELYPTANDKPNAEITASGGSGEVGSSYTLPTATLKITDVGSYEYGPATGISFAIGDVTLSQGSNSKSNDSVMVKDSTIKLQATDTETLYTDSSKSYTFKGTASYSQGAVPVTNLGNAYASAQIPAGDVTIADKTVTFSGYRLMFAGGTTASTIDSKAIRALKYNRKHTSKPSTSSYFEFQAEVGDTSVIFAYPSSVTGTPKVETYTMSWGPAVGFEAADPDTGTAYTAQVADYRGSNADDTLNGATTYKYLKFKFASPCEATTKYRVYF